MLKIVNNTLTKVVNTSKVGEFYARIGHPDSLYIVVRYHENSQYWFGLVNLRSGIMYGQPSLDPNDIFDDFSNKFYLISGDVTITID